MIFNIGFSKTITTYTSMEDWLDFGFDFGDLLKDGHDFEISSLRRQW